MAERRLRSVLVRTCDIILLLYRASHQRSECCEFDSSLGLRNVFQVISYISVNKIYRHIETTVLAVCMSHVQTSTYRSFLSAGSSMVRASNRRSYQKVAGSILVFMGLRNIFSEFAIKLE